VHTRGQIRLTTLRYIINKEFIIEGKDLEMRNVDFRDGLTELGA